MNIVIYSKNQCSQCDRAKAILKAHSVEFTELKLHEDFTTEDIRQLFPNARSYPVIIVDGYNVGSSDQLMKMLSEQYNDPRKFLTEGL